MLRGRVCASLFFSVSGILVLAPSVASAHGSWGFTCPRRNVGQLPPTVDGLIGPGEYADAWQGFQLLYRPRVSFTPAPVYVISTQNDLYIAVQDMPLHVGTETPFVSVVFDISHDGGTVARRDDVSFVVSENGTRWVQRGDGAGGFVNAPEITGWNSARTIGDITWTVEFRIPLALIGSAGPPRVLGFHIRHNWLRHTGDDYVWPPTGAWNVPNTWADLQMSAALSGPRLYLEQARITQGLEYDWNAGCWYDMVAGKDLVVLAQVYGTESSRSVRDAECIVHCYYPNAPPTTLRVSLSPPPAINPYEFSFFTGVRPFTTWVPGSAVAQPGFYRFTLRVWLEGIANPFTLELGTRYFNANRDVRLLLLPWQNTFDTTWTRTWGADLIRAIPPAMEELNRTFPTRSGVSPFRWNPSPAVGGLRYQVLQTGGTCAPSDANFDACDQRGRRLANNSLHYYNAWLSTQPSATQRDRFDFAPLLVAMTSSQGGQRQTWHNGFRFDPSSAGIGFDTSSWGAFVVIHEISHCFGVVIPGTPNSCFIPGGGRGTESKHDFIPIGRNQFLINLLTRSFVGRPRSLMGGHDPTSETFHEGYEWNVIRRNALALPSRLALSLENAKTAATLFQFVGAIDLQDFITMDYCRRVDNLALPLTSPDDKSPYKLRFLSGTGIELGSLKFPVHFQGIEGNSTVASLMLTASLPAGTTRFEIRKDTALLFAMSFSSRPPVVSNVVAAPRGQNGFDLTWNATDPDSTQLAFNIYFLPQPSGVRQLVAMGLTGTAYFFDIMAAPATTNGRLIVEASDGYNTGEGQSNLFTIAPKAPSVAIIYPTSSTKPVANQPLILAGGAYDFTIGPLTGNALTWSSDKAGALGSGGKVEVKLVAGSHKITLKATAPSGQTASAQVTLNVLTDTDGDGLPDVYENQHSCLSATVADSHLDPDKDNLASLEEWRRGTDPCEPDSDDDGIGDGDEVKLGSDPLDGNELPLPDLLYIAENKIDLGSSYVPLTKTILVTASAPNVTWATSVDSPWITATGSGQGNGQITVRPNASGLFPGNYLGHLAVNAASGQTRMLDVIFAVLSATASRPSWQLYE